LQSEPHWLDPDIVVELNRALLEGTSEPHSLIRPELLESACARPYSHWAYDGVEDIATLATVLLFAICANHPFLQGNKRTGFAAMRIFIEDNGYRLGIGDDLAWADDMVAVIDGSLSQETFADRLRGALSEG
jgi:death-on-curing protein